jgi:hypothetical protein
MCPLVAGPEAKRSLMVPRLVTRLFAALDDEGACCPDNVDVGGILVTDRAALLYLFGLLNAPRRVTPRCWQATSQPPKRSSARFPWRRQAPPSAAAQTPHHARHLFARRRDPPRKYSACWSQVKAFLNLSLRPRKLTHGPKRSWSNSTLPEVWNGCASWNCKRRKSTVPFTQVVKRFV